MSKEKIKKLTKKEEKEAKEALSKFILAFSKEIEKAKKGFIHQMVASMVIQARIISDGKKKGFDVQKLMPKIQEEYEKFNN